MRTGGGAGRPRGRPRGRPLPRYILSSSQSLLRRLAGARARPPARSLARALAPPPRHVTGQAPPGSAAPSRSAAGTELPLPAAGLVPRLSEQLSATSARAGHRCRPHPRLLTEERKKLARTDAASLRGLTQVCGRRAEGGAGKRLELEGLGWL